MRAHFQYSNRWTTKIQQIITKHWTKKSNINDFHLMVNNNNHHHQRRRREKSMQTILLKKYFDWMKVNFVMCAHFFPSCFWKNSNFLLRSTFSYFMFTIIKWKWNKKATNSNNNNNKTWWICMFALSLLQKHMETGAMIPPHTHAQSFFEDCKRKMGRFSKFQFPSHNVCASMCFPKPSNSSNVDVFFLLLLLL